MQTDAEPQDEEAIQVFHWRVQRFKALKFTLWQSRRLATVQADWHDAERLLERGWPINIVFDLLS